jgi:hypothetical protein
VAKRYLGLVSDNVLQYTSSAYSIATNPTFTTTGLTANTKYTFVFVATDSNGYSGSSTAATPRGGNGDGSIYTLAPPSPSTLTLTYNGGGSSLTTVSFTYSFTTVSSNNTGLSITDYNGNLVKTEPVAAGGSGAYTSTSTIAGSATNKNTLYSYNVYVLNAAGVGSGISVCNQTIQTCTWADISAASFVLPDTLNRIYNSVSNSSFTNFIGTATSCTFSRSGGTQAGFTSAVQSINNCIDFSYCSANTQYTYYLTPYNLLNYGAETIQCKSIINQARPTVTALYGKIYSLWDPSGITMTYNGAASSLTIVSFSYITTPGYTDSTLVKLYDYTATLVTSSTSTATIAGSATTPNTIYRYYGLGRNYDYYYSTNIIACAAYVDTCTLAKITYAEFAPLDTANRIYNSSLNASIVGITGNYTSFTFGRENLVGYSLVGYRVYNTTLQTGTSCIDMSTNLTANTQHQYQLYPYNKLGYGVTSWSTSSSFTAITNKYSVTSTSTGYIYTLADPSGITIRPNTAKIENNIQFSLTSISATYMSWNNNAAVKIIYTIGDIYAGGTTWSNTSDSFTGISSKAWKDNLIPNTIYLFKFYILNGDGVGLDISACSYKINLCSMANITSTPTFCYPNTQQRIYDSSTNSTITDICGNFSYYIVTRSIGTAGAVTYTSPKQTSETFIDTSINLIANTQYYYVIYIYTQFDVSAKPFNTIFNRLQIVSIYNNAKNSLIYSPPDLSNVTVTYSLPTVVTNYLPTITTKGKNTGYASAAIFDSSNRYIGPIDYSTTGNTVIPTTYTGTTLLVNTVYTFIITIYNSEPKKYTNPVENIGASITITLCTGAKTFISPCGSFVKPNTRYRMYNSVDDATIRGLDYQCSYYIVKRSNINPTNLALRNTVYYKVDCSNVRTTGKFIDLSTNLAANSQYEYSILFYNQYDISANSGNIFNTTNTASNNKIYTLADPSAVRITTVYVSPFTSPISYTKDAFNRTSFYYSFNTTGQLNSYGESSYLNYNYTTSYSQITSTITVAFSTVTSATTKAYMGYNTDGSTILSGGSATLYISVKNVDGLVGQITTVTTNTIDDSRGAIVIKQ